MRAATTGGADVLTARDQQIVIERDLGDTIVEISRRHGISHQRVSVITRRGREVVTKPYMDLLVASNTGEQCAYVIPTDPTTRSRSTFDPGS
jgi:transcriptional regulator